MSLKSWVISKIIGGLHPDVARQAAEIICQILVQQGVANVTTTEVEKRVACATNRTFLAAVQKPGSSHAALGLFLNEVGQLSFWQYESQFNGEGGLIAQIEALWRQVYTVCAIATALQMQGKKVEVRPTPEGLVQAIGISD